VSGQSAHPGLHRRARDRAQPMLGFAICAKHTRADLPSKFDRHGLRRKKKISARSSSRFEHDQSARGLTPAEPACVVQMHPRGATSIAMTALRRPPPPPPPPPGVGPESAERAARETASNGPTDRCLYSACRANTPNRGGTRRTLMIRSSVFSRSSTLQSESPEKTQQNKSQIRK